MIFSNEKLDIILKRKNLETCEHSSFFLILDEIVFQIKIIFLNFRWSKSDRPVFLSSWTA